MEAKQWLSVLKTAKHKSGGVHPYLWSKAEKPPVRSGTTAEYIRFCSWLKATDIVLVTAPDIQASTNFLRLKMLDNGAVPYELVSRTLTPVKECQYLVSDSISTAIAAQVCGDEDVLGRSLDFIRWSYSQLPVGKFLPIWYNFELPQTTMPDHWSQQPTCHQSLVAQLDLDEFVCSTWGDSVVDDIGDVLDLAIRSRTAAGLFEADRYKPPTPLMPHFITCESILKYLAESGDSESLQVAADGALAGVKKLYDANCSGDSVEPDGTLVGHRRPRLIATAVRAGLMANIILGEEIVGLDMLNALMSSLMESRFDKGPFAGLLPVSTDSQWEEDTLVCVAGCMAAFQAHTLLAEHEKGYKLGAADFRILV